MTLPRLRHALLAFACLSGALLAACGGGEVESQLAPKRIVAFGDGFADLGQGGSKYTVNDGSVNNWTQQLAARYGIAVQAAVNGGSSFARGNARIATQPDAAGGDVPPVSSQIDGFLAAGGRFDPDDLVIINAGISDIVAEVGQTRAGTQGADQALADIVAASRALGEQVRRLTAAGAEHVVVVGPYNLGRSPWAITTGQVGLLQDYSVRFNQELLISIVDLGAKVLYVDAALHYNLVTANPANYGFSNFNEAACTSVDPGPGIGIGENQVNSALCNRGTLRAGVDPNTWVFADAIYPGPYAHVRFGDYAYDRIRFRW